MAAIDVTEWADTAAQYDTTLKLLPYMSIGETLQHMNPIPGVQYSKVAGQLTGNPHLKLHDGTKRTQGDMAAIKRVLQTRVGDLIIEEDPEALRATILGRRLLGNNAKLEEHPMKLQMLALIMTSVGENLASNIFVAAYNATPDDTSTLFDGFDTITAAEIADNKLTIALNNYDTISVITDNNAYDELRAAYRSIDARLKKMKTKMYISVDIHEAYNEAYKTEFGAIPYNTQFNKTFLEGSNGMCELVPLIGKTASDYVHITTQENMEVGFDASSDTQSVNVRVADNPWKLQFSMKANFGVQFGSIDAKLLKVFKIQ